MRTDLHLDTSKISEPTEAWTLLDGRPMRVLLYRRDGETVYCPFAEMEGYKVRGLYGPSTFYATAEDAMTEAENQDLMQARRELQRSESHLRGTIAQLLNATRAHEEAKTKRLEAEDRLRRISSTLGKGADGL